MSLPIFIDPLTTIKVKFVLAAKKGEPKVLYADLTKKELLENYTEADPETIEEHWAEFRAPNFEDQSAIMSEAVHFNSDGVVGDPSAIQFARFRRLLKAWSFGPSVSVDQIKKLNPFVAMVMDAALQQSI